MHELCEREGANRNVVWSIKLKHGAWRYFSYPDPFQYIPPKKYVDIIAWATCNLNRPDIGVERQSLREMMGRYYSWVGQRSDGRRKQIPKNKRCHVGQD
jgi:hypothetical protein